MSRKDFPQRTFRVALLLLLAVLSRVLGGWGGEPIGLCQDAAPRDVSNGRITLSIRIAEAKGNASRRTYYRSLLRRRKRNPAAQSPRGPRLLFPPSR